MMTASLGLAVLAMILSGPIAPPETSARTADIARQRAELGLAVHAKLLCSGVFVVGRAPREFIKNDLQREGRVQPGWEEIKVEIDREKKTVTLRAKDLSPGRAVYNGDQGCCILPDGRDQPFFQPVTVTPKLPDAATQDWPMGDRIVERSLPSEVNRAAIEAALDFAFDDSVQAVPQHTRALLVVHQGRIIAERYAPGFGKDTRHISWSMGKSITSALIGILVGEGRLKVDDPAPIAAWQKTGDLRARILIRDLLHMSSGLRFHRGEPLDGTLYTERDNHHYVYLAPINVFDYCVNREVEFAPNTRWRYRNCDPLILGKIIRDTVERTGREYLSFPQRALFNRIGIRNMVLETDCYGNFIMTGFDYGTARDWARFGLLHLRDGMWNGKRILPAGWVSFVRTPAPAAPRRGYGGLFWLNRDHAAYKSLPEDMLWPAGHHGQSVNIIPSREMVIVRLGHSDKGGTGRYMEKVIGKILAAVTPSKE